MTAEALGRIWQHRDQITTIEKLFDNSLGSKPDSSYSTWNTSFEVHDSDEDGRAKPWHSPYSEDGLIQDQDAWDMSLGL